MTLNRGTRQGCPLSPHIFALCIEPLANWVRMCEEVKCIEMGSKMYKISLFADNMVVYMTNPQSSLKALHEILNDFYCVSGLKTNFDKSDIFPIKVVHADIKMLQSCSQFPWVRRQWTHLGIDIPINLHQLYYANFNEVSKAIKHQLLSMKFCAYFWLDEIHILKTFILHGSYSCSECSL